MSNFKSHLTIGLSTLLTVIFVSNSPTIFSIPKNNYEIQQLKHKAKKGDKRAQYLLGYAYMSGSSVDYNRRKALRWLKKSAAQNYYNAWYRLGEMHYDKVFGIHNYSRSFKWFFKPAIKNHGVSQYKVAMLYFKGNGVTQSSAKALIWASRAKKNGIAHAAALIHLIQEKMTAVARAPTPRKIKPKTVVPKFMTPKEVIRSGKPLDVPSILSFGKWSLNGNPSDHLPSSNTRCVTITNKIRCTSKVKIVKKSGYTANYRIVSLITNFGPHAKFTIRYRNKYTSVVHDKPGTETKQEQDDDTNDEFVTKTRGPRLGIGTKVFQFQCRATRSNQIRCIKSDNSKLVFTKR